MRNKTTVVMMFLMLFLLLEGCGGGPGGGILTGSVLKFYPSENSYSPFSSATVTDKTDNNVTTTLSDGTYSFSGASKGDHILVMASPGYTTTYRRAEVLAGFTQAEPAILSPLDSKTTRIGTAGGTATNTLASIKLDIPQNSLSSTVDISLTMVKLVAAPYEPPVNEYFISVIVYISPVNVTLTPEATLTIPNLTGLPEGYSDINFYYFNTESVMWQSFDANPIAHQDPAIIDAKIGRFGWIAATLPISPQAGIIKGVIRDYSTSNGIPYASVWSSGIFSVADRFGAYELQNVPTGEVTVEADAPQYEHGSGNVTVEAGKISDLNIYLNPLNFGTVSGKVMKIPGYSAISGARVVYSQDKETTTDNYGRYTLYEIPPGVATVYAYKSGYYSSSGEGNVPSGGQVNIDIYLGESGRTPTGESYDMESWPSGWIKSSSTSEVIWQIIDNSQDIINTFESLGIIDFPDVTGPPYEAHLPDAYEGTHSMWFGDASRGAYSGPLLATTTYGGTSKDEYIYGYLTSEAIDLRDWVYATFSFWTWWEIEGVNPGKSEDRTYDEMLILITKDGGDNWPDNVTWFDVAKLNPLEDPNKDVTDEKLPYSSAGHNKTGVWVKHIFDLTPYVGNKIRLLFRFDTGDRKYNGFRGWCLDDISITPSQPGTLSISEAALPRKVHVDSPVRQR